MTPAQAAYELAKAKHQAAHRALCVAKATAAPVSELQRLKSDLNRLLRERTKAFSAYSHEIIRHQTRRHLLDYPP